MVGGAPGRARGAAGPGVIPVSGLLALPPPDAASQEGGLGVVGQHPKELSPFQKPSQVDLQPQRHLSWGGHSLWTQNHWAVASGQRVGQR